MSLPNDMSRIAQALSRLEGSSDEYVGSPKIAARTLIRKSIRFTTASVLANGTNAIAANAAASERMMANGRVLGAYFIPQGTATAATANNANLKVTTVLANGAVGTTVASITTNTSANGGTGNLVSGVPVSLTVTDIANARFTKGTVIGPAVDQNSSGVAVPAGTMQVDIELEGAATDYAV